MAIKAIRRKTDGVVVYQIDFRDQQGRRVRETAGTTRTQAKSLQAKRIGEVRAGTYVNPRDVKRNNPTFGDFADRFLEEYASSRRSDYYRQALRPADPVKGTPAGPVRRYFEGRRIREITPADLDRFRSHSESTDRVGPSTVRKRLTLLGTVFKMARRWCVLDTNPAADLPKPSEPHHKVRFLSREEWVQLRGVAPPDRRAIYLLALATGLRLKEVTGLRWEDVNLPERRLHVAEDTKTGTRVVPLGEEAKRVLEGQREARKTVGREQGRLTPYVFTDLEGEHFHSRERRNKLTKAALADMKAAGIHDASFHTLRHTAASWIAQAGRTHYELQRILGHSTPVMTQRYVHLEPKHLRAAVESIDASIRGVDTPVDTSSTCDPSLAAPPSGSATLPATSDERAVSSGGRAPAF